MHILLYACYIQMDYEMKKASYLMPSDLIMFNERCFKLSSFFMYKKLCSSFRIKYYIFILCNYAL